VVAWGRRRRWVRLRGEGILKAFFDGMVIRMALDLMGWFEQWVVPALVARLDVALPEFGWRRRATYWQATAKMHTEGLWGVRAEYVLAHDRTWWGISVNDHQRFVPWLLLPLDGEVDAGGDHGGGDNGGDNGRDVEGGG
jgi:hypothetical protein